MNFTELRKKYPTFIFKDYSFENNAESIEIEFNFEIKDLSSFSPKWSIPKLNTFRNLNVDILDKLVFSLGMAELISYWKLTCSPEIIIKKGFLSPEQINWWQKLYFNGLGEFFYLNEIDVKMDSFVSIRNMDAIAVSANNIAGNLDKNDDLSGFLIPIGGGKDSIVTLDILSKHFETNTCYVVNQRLATARTVEIAGYKQAQVLSSARKIDPQLIKLNQAGYLNGHTPFSSIVAFSSILSAYILGKKNIALSNESSANESTIVNSNVNHQYSKSFEFEKDFREYVDKYSNFGINYFSLLRPLSEIKIAQHFSKLVKYHHDFKSCNCGSKEDKWCNNCPKCLFVYIILSPFISSTDLQNIFGENLYEKETLLSIFEQLIGRQANKPFECVGNREEINLALKMTINNFIHQKKELPFLLREYLKFSDTQINKELYKNLDFYDRDNFLTKELEDELKEKVYNGKSRNS